MSMWFGWCFFGKKLCWKEKTFIPLNIVVTLEISRLLSILIHHVDDQFHYFILYDIWYYFNICNISVLTTPIHWMAFRVPVNISTLLVMKDSSRWLLNKCVCTIVIFVCQWYLSSLLKLFISTDTIYFPWYIKLLLLTWDIEVTKSKCLCNESFYNSVWFQSILKMWVFFFTKVQWHPFYIKTEWKFSIYPLTCLFHCQLNVSSLYVYTRGPCDKWLLNSLSWLHTVRGLKPAILTCGITFI